MSLSSGVVVSQRYELDKLLGRGGMGTVWQALDKRLRRRVAIKFLQDVSQVSAEERARFLLEARAAGQLTHPGVVTVHDIDIDHDPPFLVMELLAGPSLAGRLAAAGPLDVREAVRLAREVAGALAHAHDAGLVHRDIKPGNLVFDAHGALKICDFGIVRFHDAVTQMALTSSGMATPHYAAPEQLADEPVDGRTDLYALGCVLFEMLTGRPPFDGSFTALIAKHASATPPAPSALRDDVPGNLDRLVLELLAKRPEDRPSSAAVAAERLGSIWPAPAAQPSARPARPTASKSPPPPRRAGRRSAEPPRGPRRAGGSLRPVSGAELEFLGLDGPVPLPRYRETGYPSGAVAAIEPDLLLAGGRDGIQAIGSSSRRVIWRSSGLVDGSDSLGVCSRERLVHVSWAATPDDPARIRCLDLRDGRVLWTQVIADPTHVEREYRHVSYAAARHVVVTGVNDDPGLTAWDTESGKPRFSIDARVGHGYQLRALPNGYILRRELRELIAHEPQRGAVAWSAHGWAPVMQGEHVIVDRGKAGIAVLDSRNGKAIRTIEYEWAAGSYLAGAFPDGILIVRALSHSHRLECYSAAGRLLWSRPFRQCEHAWPKFVSRGRVLIMMQALGDSFAPRWSIARLDPGNGNIVWAATTRTPGGLHPGFVFPSSALFWRNAGIIEVDPAIA